MPAYPTNIASDNDLIVAENRKTTTLLGTVSAGVTTLVFTSGVFPPNSVITIENERILLGTSTVSGTYINCTRGYDDSTAASHASGATANANVVAAHHNVLREEIQAIETTLGANLSFVQQTFNASGFTFSAPGNNTLTAAVPALILLDPAPLGITASSPNTHYLYITDGASSEAVLITSASFAPGEVTVGFTPANSHTINQWTLGSATGGIQEAIKYAEAQSAGGSVQIPRGNTRIYAPISISGNVAVDVFGSANGSRIIPGTHTTIQCSSAAQIFSLRNFGISYLNGPGAVPAISLSNGVAGNVTVDGIAIALAYQGIYANGMDYLTISNCVTASVYQEGIVVNNCNNCAILNNRIINANTSDSSKAGIRVSDGGTINVIGNMVSNAATTSYGIYFGPTAPASITVSGNTVFANSGAFYNANTSAISWVIGDNSGYSNVRATHATASTVTLGPQMVKTIFLTGTTTVNTINGYWGTGQEIILICENGLTFSTAGNIKTGLTTTSANQVVRGIWDDLTDVTGKWYLYT